MWVLMMNSRRAKPTPLLGSLLVSKAMEGFAKFSMILVSGFGMEAMSIFSVLNGR